jgi:CBS domain-containing protein
MAGAGGPFRAGLSALNSQRRPWKAVAMSASDTLLRKRIVSDVMTSRVHVAGPDMPFKLLVRLIEENRVSAVPIVDEGGFPIGIVSESDLLNKERHQAEFEVASDIMSAPPATVRADASLAEANRLMRQKKVRRLIAVDARGRIAGIVSRSDLLPVTNQAVVRAGAA